ncbi:MAG: hypothetical protein GEV12_11695 [Micromonosporaceae bacterium]|nr:hypothetical protein [Micromonosporaceae bacterium]
MASAKSPPSLATALLVAAGIVVLQAVLVPLFAGLAANAEPRDLPVLVAGPAPAADQLATRLAQERPGAFEITRVESAAAADQALRDREGYAAFVLGPGGVSLHTASAASPVVAQLLTSAATEIGGGQVVPVRDVVPGSPDDPRGAGFAAGFLPLALTSMLAGIVLALVVPGRWARLAGLVVYAVLAGLAGAAVLQSWLGVLGGDFLMVAAAIGLFALATAGLVLGLGAALGGPGIGLGALLAFLVGNPLSAVAAAPELLPQPWGLVGQWLPPGAGGALLRSVAWFDSAGSEQPLWTLGGTAVLGIALVLVGRASFGRVSEATAAQAPAG